MRSEEPVAAGLEERYMSLIMERAGHEPLQYITGTQEFMGLLFEVNENVLIPRQDTELLAEHVISCSAGKRVIDMCTGSGCIAVSVALLGKPSSVTAVDVSEKALDVARHNADINGVWIDYVKSNLWDEVSEVYDIVVSNPPYITDSEMKELMPEVKDHEPEIALRGGNDGLDYYRRIIAGAGEHLVNNGMILFEIGCAQGNAVSCMLKENGYTDVRIEKDMAGLDRVVRGIKT